MNQLPPYGFRAYALFYRQHSTKDKFKQSELNGIISSSMKKKIFALLVKAGWLEKASRQEYRCISLEKIIKNSLKPVVPDLLKTSDLPYALTGHSALELWKGHTGMQRNTVKTPYFIKVLKTDVQAWKNYLNHSSIPNYVENGSTIGEFVVLIPAARLRFAKRKGLKVERLWQTVRQVE
ncbi:MAG: hypothetical protein Q8R15_03380 [Candidatus Micrarchaeota archaeon]|nr:hypothetical protein [Candidatus Micrarchaeota archaeon]